MVKSIFDAQSHGPDDLSIEAWIEKDGATKKARVDVSRIAYRTDNNDGTSSIVLTDGNEIVAALTLDQLDEKIRHHNFKDGEMIDLKPVTGKKALAEYRQKELLQAFNASAEAEGSMVISLHAFQHDNRVPDDTMPLLIKEKDITRWEEDKTFNRPAEIGYIGLDGKPTGSQSFFFFMPIEELQRRVAVARGKGLKTLDLLEETRPPAKEKRVISPSLRIIS